MDPAIENSYLVIALITQCVITGLILVHYSRQYWFCLQHPFTTYALFHLLVFVIRPAVGYLFYYTKMWDYMGVKPPPETQALAFFVSLVGFVALYAGVYLSSCRSVRSHDVAPAIRLERFEWHALILAILLLTPLGLASVISGLGGSKGEWVGNVYVFRGSTGYLVQAQEVFIGIGIIILALSRFKWWGWAPLICFASFRAYVGFGRWAFILAIWYAVMVGCTMARRKWPAPKVLGAGFVLLLLFAQIGLDRYFIQEQILGRKVRTEGEGSRLESLAGLLDSPDFANFEYLNFILAAVPDRSGTYTYGSQYLQLFTEPVPRALWPSKPVGKPIQLVDLNRYGNFRGLTLSLVGDAWMSGGWVGVALTLGATGWLLGQLYTVFSRRKRSLRASLFLLGIFAMLPQLFRDGGITIFKFCLFTLLPIALWSGLSACLRPRQRIRRAFPAKRIVRTWPLPPDLKPLTQN